MIDPHLAGALDFIAMALVLLGALIAIPASVGVLRLPDHYLRAHCVAAIAIAAAPLTLAGLALGAAAAEDFAVAGRLALLVLVLVLFAPLSAHLSAAAAHASGLAPSLDPASDARDARRGAAQ